MLASFAANAQSGDAAEYRVKLAFLYNFTQYIQWPPDAFNEPEAPFTICVSGQDPFKGVVEETLRGRKSGNHAILIKKLLPNEDPRACHMVFFRVGGSRTTEKMLALLRGSNTLTVGESKGFVDEGGLINLTIDENRLRFEVNLNVARQTRLKMNSNLLSLAKIVDSK